MIPNPSKNLTLMLLVSLMLSSLFVIPQGVKVGEGGTSHVLPGATATLIDLPPTAPGWFFKPMYCNYSGNKSAQIPTAAGLAGNLDATANTVVLGGGFTFDQTVFGDAHYSIAAFLPYPGLTFRPTCKHPAAAERHTAGFRASAT